MSIFSRLAEQKIEEAIRNGEFDNLPLAGKNFRSTIFRTSRRI